MPDPEFIELSEMFRVNLFRKHLPMVNDGENSVKDSVKFGESSVKDSEKIGDITINETQRKILLLIAENNQISAAKIAERVHLSIRAIEKNIKELRDSGILIRHGSAHGGYWEVRI